MSATDDILHINPLLMERVRLAILATLAASHHSMDFNTLLEKLSLTKGNLSVHARKLEEASLIQIEKKFVGNKPVTTYKCTENGYKELKLYLEKIENIISSISQ
jgi:DNA-binding transcriptional ArsR family regulator